MILYWPHYQFSIPLYGQIVAIIFALTTILISIIIFNKYFNFGAGAIEQQ